MKGTSVRWSVVELGEEWAQGRTLAHGEGKTDTLAQQVATRLESWLADCDTGDKAYSPALEINIEAVNR